MSAYLNTRAWAWVIRCTAAVYVVWLWVTEADQVEGKEHGGYDNNTDAENSSDERIIGGSCVARRSRINWN